MKLIPILMASMLSLVVINLYATFNIGKNLKSIISVYESEQQILGSNGESGIVKVSPDGDPVKGRPDAPVTIVEFSDFQCPFCGSFFEQTLPQIEEKYIRSGKVNLVYRDFPLDFHKNAQKAAEAAECANAQGRFWVYHDKIFENQNALDADSLKKYAKDAGINVDKFNKCLDSGEMAREVQKDLNDGLLMGVEGTPAFFINDVKIVGSQPYSVFEQVIESKLNT